MLSILPLVLALPTVPHAVQEEPIVEEFEVGDIVLGPEENRYRWVPGWLQVPDGMQLGNTHGCVAVDSKGRVFFNTDSDHSIVIARPDGTIETTWGKEWAGGLHGMTLVEE
ncbi:MAG: hypothetical protein AAGG01_21070, partial [Planctomycetota bacterium]